MHVAVGQKISLSPSAAVTQGERGDSTAADAAADAALALTGIDCPGTRCGRRRRSSSTSTGSSSGT